MRAARQWGRCRWQRRLGGGRQLRAVVRQGCRRAAAGLLQTAETLLRGSCIRALPARLDSGCHRAARARLGKAARVWVLQHPAHRSPSVGGMDGRAFPTLAPPGRATGSWLRSTQVCRRMKPPGGPVTVGSSTRMTGNVRCCRSSSACRSSASWLQLIGPRHRPSWPWVVPGRCAHVAVAGGDFLIRPTRHAGAQAVARAAAKLGWTSCSLSSTARVRSICRSRRRS